MIDQENRSRQGFTLIEASAAITILIIALGVALGGFMYTLKKTNELDVQSELDIDVQLAMERLKNDLRLSSLDEIFYYPAGPGPYTAISFPLAEDKDGDGLFELEADGSIIWSKTLVYHIWPSSPHQLRVTTFRNRPNTLTDAERQEQLNSVVATGSGQGTYNGGNATTSVVFENLLDWSIRPKKGMFDAYSPTTERESVNMGFVLMDNGAHTFQFKVAGKNPESTGYNIGIDQLVVSPSYGAREAEAQLPAVAQSGASPVAQYVASGSWKGNHQLYFPATGVDQSFTLKMGNDRWEETNFGADGYTAENTTVVFDEGLSPKDFVIELEGDDVAWQAAMQTGSGPVNLVTNSLSLTNTWIGVHLNGAELLTNGNWIAYNGKRCKLTFQAATNGQMQIQYAYIGPTTSTETNVPSWASYQIATFGGIQSTPVLNPGESITSDWIDMEINKTNNYIVFYRLSTDPDHCYPAGWKNNRVNNSWDSHFYTLGTYSNAVYGLSAVTVSYPAKGTYTSQIFDTRLKNPIYNDLAWNANLPPGTVISTKVRTGNHPDLNDAADWSTITASTATLRTITASYKRYVQFQAELISSPDGLSTPQLKDLTIDWNGEMQLVNIGGILTKGPEYGIVEVLVDGIPLQSALSIDLMIYKDVYNMNKQTKRVTSSLIADIRPRNTGM